jgi:hypothetical protein
MEDSNHTQRSTGTNNRRRGSAGGNTASKNPNTQETKNGPNQVDSGRGWLRAARDPEGEDKNHSADQWTTKPAEGAQETASNPITQEPGGTKRPTVQEAGARKKTKAQ